MRTHLGVTTLLALLLAPAVRGDVTAYSNFTDYDAAVGGQHDLFVDFETDKDGMDITPAANIEGATFSCDVAYSSPDGASTLVNIADIGQGIDNEIGPFPAWTGTLRWEYTTTYTATAFTGVSVEAGTEIRFYNGGDLVDQIMVDATEETFEFFGFVTTNPFDRVELDGIFFAIDAHYSTLAPECFLVIGSDAGSEAFSGIGHTWQTQVAGISNAYPVTLTDLPAFRLPLQTVEKASRAPRTVVGRFHVQVLMWNPEVFPNNPEQYTEGLEIVLWTDGRVTARRHGTADNMGIGMEVFRDPVDGLRYVRFPFTIDFAAMSVGDSSLREVARVRGAPNPVGGM